MHPLRHSQQIAAVSLLLGGCATWISARGDATSGPVAISAPQAPFEVAQFKQLADAVPSLATEDFLSVMSSSGEFLAMVEASRAWLQVRPAIGSVSIGYHFAMQMAALAAPNVLYWQAQAGLMEMFPPMHQSSGFGL